DEQRRYEQLAVWQRRRPGRRPWQALRHEPVAGGRLAVERIELLGGNPGNGGPELRGAACERRRRGAPGIAPGRTEPARVQALGEQVGWNPLVVRSGEEELVEPLPVAVACGVKRPRHVPVLAVRGVGDAVERQGVEELRPQVIAVNDGREV